MCYINATRRTLTPPISPVYLPVARLLVLVQRKEKRRIKWSLEKERGRDAAGCPVRRAERMMMMRGFWLRCLLYLSVKTLHTLRAPTLTLYFCPGNSHPPAQPKRLPVIITCTARSPLWKGNKLSHTPLTVPPTPSNTGVFLINP